MVSKYQNIFKTLIEMLSDRHFDISEYSGDFKIDSIASMDKLVFKHNNDNTYIKIFYNIDEKIGINYIKNIIVDLESCIHKTSGLLILNSSITTFAKQFINSDQNSQNIEYFKETDLMTNKTKHYLIPQHILLSKSEKLLLFADLKCNEKHIPRIKCTDPISQYFGAKIGDVFKIIRYDDNTPSIYFRLCI